MKYAKGALTFEEQADRLLARGLSADRDELIGRLRAVSYYRLSGYLYPFREREADGSASDPDRFVAGANLGTVWQRYCLDRRLRVLTLDAIERIEVSVRTKLVYHFSPLLPKGSKYPDWAAGPKLPNDRCGVILLLCRYMLRLISQTSRWHVRVESLLAEYPDVPRQLMGLPADWRAHPVWVGPVNS